MKNIRETGKNAEKLTIKHKAGAVNRITSLVAAI